MNQPYTGDDLCDGCGEYASDCTCEFVGDVSALHATAEYTGRCPDCDSSGYVTVDIAQAGDQTLTEEHVCPTCGGG